MGARSELSEQKILDAATDLFLSQGIAATTVDEIADSAGVARRTVFNRFGTKEAVLEAVLDRQWCRYQPPSPTITVHDTTDLDRALRLIGHSIVDFNHSTRQVEFAQVLIAEGARHPGLVARFHDQGKGKAMRTFATFLRTQVTRGLLDCPDIDLAALQFLGLVQEPLIWPRVTRTPVRRHLTPAAVVDSAVAMFLARYATQPRPTENTP